MPLSLAVMQPVPRGLIAAEQVPGASVGAVGGNGREVRMTGSGAGGRGAGLAAELCIVPLASRAASAVTARAVLSTIVLQFDEIANRYVASYCF
jgi:hypothetical protein